MYTSEKNDRELMHMCDCCTCTSVVKLSAVAMQCLHLPSALERDLYPPR